MKAYGLPRHRDIEFPNLANVAYFGLKTGRLNRRWTANGTNKRRARRYWKRKARAKGRKEIVDIMGQL